MLPVRIDNSLKSDTAQKRSAAELDQRFLHRELTYVSLIDQEAVHHMMTADLTPRLPRLRLPRARLLL